MQETDVSIPSDAFHARPAENVLAEMRSDPDGLTSEEAKRRLQYHGRNELPATPPRHPLWRLLAQFHNALIYFLLAGALAAWVLGHYLDASVIVAVVLVNAVVGFIQEGKAENALAAIRRMISPHTHVLRNGERVSIPVAELVPGDVTLLEAGDRVPADVRLLRARGMLIEEAILTGESVASEKHESPVPVAAALGDRSSMAFSGTMVASGQGAGVVVATGLATEIGHVSRLLGEVQQLTTPLLRQINDFGRRFTWIAICTAALLFTFAVLVRSYQWDEALIAVVALTVGAVPEGLPAVITITLAIGVQRMAARNAIIRRLPAVETLGATSVICSDKTGTLTRNEMTARRIVVPHGEILVSGAGYEPKGELINPSGSDDAASRLAATSLARAALLCNDAHLHEKPSGWAVNGDPMEGALVTLALKAGLDASDVRTTWPRLEEIPFDAQHRFMATLHRVPDDEGNVIFVKGAPERVLEMCALQDCGHHTQALDMAYWTERIAAAASNGERVLGFAMKTPDGNDECLTFSDVESGLVFLGIVGFIDPPRPEVVEAIAECNSAGIRVKMITGDHAATAAAIARQLGLGEAPRVLTGHDLDTLSDDALREAVSDTAVFARTSPEHKLRIVRALQANGHIVAMTGDGVNDAPALKQADVGIAMGHKGTEAAKEASEIVLLDDNFASIVAAVHEGRTVYDNIQKVTSWTLPTNGGEALTVVAAILFGFTMPMTPVEILWINLITSITLGLALAFEPPEKNVMRRPPRKADAGLLTPFLVWRVVFVSLIFVACALGIFFYALGRGLSLDLARTMVVNTIVVLEIFYLFNVRYLHMTSITWRGALGTPPVFLAIGTVVIAQIAFTYAPIMHELFATEPVSFADGLLIVAVGVIAMIVLEAEKHLMRRLEILKVYPEHPRNASAHTT
ncbi:cation-transporting P-type ATPase [Hyphomicrobium sp. CS1GBMeth3]|uniref:cation-transporting P-type ATPase n=1 Tax=Hyphomicrobium sp. CS1GBMeth3 TaxID=1892845 RepID=UPI000931E490|nr:cation-transporting P-type ATPase [Hyphomicrobium sp. CS1GBMeth3]